MRMFPRASTAGVAVAVLLAAGCNATSPEAPSPVASGTTTFDVVRAQASPVPVPGGQPSPTTSATPTPPPSPTTSPTPKPSATPAPPPLLVTQMSRPAYKYCEASRKAVCPTLHGDTDWQAAPFDVQANEGRIVTLDSHATSTVKPLLTFRTTRALRVQVYFNNLLEDGTHGTSQSCQGSFWPAWASAGGWTASAATETSTRRSVPAQAATFTAVEKQFAAGQTVSLGPNQLRNCDHAFRPRMYYVRLAPVKPEPLP